MSFEIGDTVGTYKIVGTIGSGAMGEVFKVEHVFTRRMEAMKILALDASSTPEQDQRFLREIQLQAGLNHPNIAAVHNAFRENGHLVMIMELVQGSSLRTLLERGRLPLAVSVDYACQALAALDYAHAHGVAHRDISPANMIVTENGTLKVTDFGLARSRHHVRLTETGALVGSLYYTPPEQVKGSGTFDIRSDIYSLGAVLYEMTTGRKPFHSENPYTLMLAHVEQKPPPPSEVSPELPPALDEILLKALEKDPEERFQSAELFRCALEGVKDRCNGVAAVQTAAVPGPGSTTIGRLRLRGLKVAAVVVFAVVFGWVWKNALFPPARPASPQNALGNAPAPARETGEGRGTLRRLKTSPGPTVGRQSEDPSLQRKPTTAAAYLRREAAVQPPKKSRNPFRRALTVVAHPFHRNNDADHAAATVKSTEQP